jgi:hypothetical protein
MNSQRRWLPRPGTIVAGRRGSHSITDRRWRSADSGTPAKPGKTDRPIDFGIDDQPGLLEIQIVQPDAQRLAHRAARAVATDGVAGAHRLAIGQGERHFVRILRDIGHARTVARVDVRIAGDGVAQRRFQLGLVEEIIVGPAKPSGPAGGAQIADHPAVGADVEMALGFAHQRKQTVDQAGALEDAHHLVVDVNGAGQGVRRGFLFQNQNRQSRLAQEVCGHGSDRPATDNGDVIGHVAHARCCVRKATKGAATLPVALCGASIGSSLNQKWPAPGTARVRTKNRA